RSFHEFHHQVIRSDIVELADVGVIERSNHSCFPFETLAEACGADFYRNLAVQPRIGCSVDFAHTASRKKRIDPVWAQRLVWLQRIRRLNQLRCSARSPGL